MQSWRRDGAGVAFSTWPDGWTQVWPGWLSEIALGFLFAVGLAAWICWAILAVIAVYRWLCSTGPRCRPASRPPGQGGFDTSTLPVGVR